jgi:hypothetical protein
LSWSSTDMKITRAFLRTSTPVVPIANSIADTIKK